MDPFLRGVQETFRRHGIEAVLDPDGLARPVRLLPARPDEIADFGSMRVQTEAGMYEVLASDFEGMGTGTMLSIGTERRKVQHSRVRDPRRLKVLLNTIEAGA